MCLLVVIGPGAELVGLDFLGIVVFKHFKSFNVLPFWEGSQDIGNDCL